MDEQFPSTPRKSMGVIEGSLQLLTPESLTLNGGASITGTLYVPGTPVLQLNDHPRFGGVLAGMGGRRNWITWEGGPL